MVVYGLDNTQFLFQASLWDAIPFDFSGAGAEAPAYFRSPKWGGCHPASRRDIR